MKTLYFECNMGAAGDMLMSALYELLNEEERAEFMRSMNYLNNFGVQLNAEQTERCGIRGTHIEVSVNGKNEAESAGDARCHAHGEHCHRHMADIERIIVSLPVPSSVRTNILQVYGLIAEAESNAHGCKVEEVHFHEVGAMDAIADITGVCLLIEMLAAERIYVSPLRTGFGTVVCAHGRLPVPAPATAFLLKNIPSYSGDLEGEYCTPTGAALLKFFADGFGQRPVMSVSNIGYGMGKKICPTANCVRAFIGETEETAKDICELVCNLDDITPEALAFASEELMKAGSLDVYTTPIAMKKGRAAFMLTCMCDVDLRDKMLGVIFKHTTTLGVREYTCRRYKLKRKETVLNSGLGAARLKEASGYGVQRQKLEYEDIARIARQENLTLRDVKNKFLALKNSNFVL